MNDEVAAPLTTITAKVVQGQRVKFTNSNTGSEAIYVTTSNSIILSKGVVYKLHIAEEHLNILDYHVIRDNPIFAPKLIIRTVNDGIAIVYPIVNNVIITDGDILGSLI